MIFAQAVSERKGEPMIRVKYTINFETDERLTEDEENELINYVSQFGDEINLDDDGVVLSGERRTDD